MYYVRTSLAMGRSLGLFLYLTTKTLTDQTGQDEWLISRCYARKWPATSVLTWLAWQRVT